MQNELIIISEYCDKCHIEPSFIEMLQEGGLIDIRTEDGERCLLFSQLPDVERYSRMYYDLSINIEGIDAIHHLLERMEEMQQEIYSLHNKLRLLDGLDSPCGSEIKKMDISKFQKDIPSYHSEEFATKNFFPIH